MQAGLALSTRFPPGFEPACLAATTTPAGPALLCGSHRGYVITLDMQTGCILHEAHASDDAIVHIGISDQAVVLACRTQPVLLHTTLAHVTGLAAWQEPHVTVLPRAPASYCVPRALRRLEQSLAEGWVVHSHTAPHCLRVWGSDVADPRQSMGSLQLAADEHGPVFAEASLATEKAAQLLGKTGVAGMPVVTQVAQGAEDKAGKSKWLVLAGYDTGQVQAWVVTHAPDVAALPASAQVAGATSSSAQQHTAHDHMQESGPAGPAPGTITVAPGSALLIEKQDLPRSAPRSALTPLLSQLHLDDTAPPATVSDDGGTSADAAPPIPAPPTLPRSWAASAASACQVSGGAVMTCVLEPRTARWCAVGSSEPYLSVFRLEWDAEQARDLQPPKFGALLRVHLPCAPCTHLVVLAGSHGHLLAGSTADMAVRLWNAELGTPDFMAPVAVLRAHAAPITGLLHFPAGLHTARADAPSATALTSAQHSWRADLASPAPPAVPDDLSLDVLLAPPVHSALTVASLEQSAALVPAACSPRLGTSFVSVDSAGTVRLWTV